MASNVCSRRRRILIPVLMLSLMALGACGTQEIVFVYPDEALDFQLRNLKMPTMYIDSVTDMRPAEQRNGQGHFFNITYPKDAAWEAPPTTIYAEALAQDLDQTNLVELVPFPAQAEYILSLDILSLSCQLKRSPATLLLSGAIGFGAGMALGEDTSDRIKLGAVLTALTLVAVPAPTTNRAEAEVRMTLKNRDGEMLWQKSCFGEIEEKKYLTATAREDQKLVDAHLTKAVKRANACLLGQMRQYLLENASAPE
ncbi:MAG: hypothetical protein ACI9UQ_001311 [Candidatus Krumholzibacteriia bacterium]|jgi:hypothetical protein